MVDHVCNSELLALVKILFSLVNIAYNCLHNQILVLCHVLFLEFLLYFYFSKLHMQILLYQFVLVDSVQIRLS